MRSSKSSFGCLPFGCLVAIVITSIVAISMLLVVRSGMRNAILTFTSDSAQTYVSPELPIDSIEGLNQKIQKLAGLCAAESLSFSAAELNFLISSDAAFAQHASVILENSEARVLFSVPLMKIQDVPFISLLGIDATGKFVNGEAVLSPTIKEGQLALGLKNLTLNGNAAPADAVIGAGEWLGDARVVEQMPTKLKSVLSKIQQLSVTGDKLELICK